MQLEGNKGIIGQGKLPLGLCWILEGNMGVRTTKLAADDRRRHSDLYFQRKRDHQCAYCGDDLPAGWRKVACTTCEKKRSKSRRTSRRARTEASAIALGFCRYHRQKEAVPGTTMCRECLDSKSAWTVEWRRKKRADAVKRGKCSFCFKKKAKEGYLRCEDCLKKERDSRAAEKKAPARALPPGKCHACKRRKVKGRDKTCPTCQEKSRNAYTRRRDGQIAAVWLLLTLKRAAVLVQPLRKAS
jgi:hypothetical protein